jgi:ribonuclease HI
MSGARNVLRAFADGGSHGNPGPAGIGVLILDEENQPVASISHYIGVATNNQAEYQAAIAAMEAISKLNPASATLRLDSELVARQLSGRYKVKSPSIAPLFVKASQMMRRLPALKIQNIDGELNQAHDLVQKAINGSKKPRTVPSRPEAL